MLKYITLAMLATTLGACATVSAPTCSNPLSLTECQERKGDGHSDNTPSRSDGRSDTQSASAGSDAKSNSTQGTPSNQSQDQGTPTGSGTPATGGENPSDGGVGGEPSDTPRGHGHAKSNKAKRGNGNSTATNGKSGSSKGQGASTQDGNQGKRNGSDK